MTKAIIQVTKGGRLRIPKAIQTIENIAPGDYVEIDIVKVNPKEKA